jgi:DNA-binding XRE family transcriptional regulator
MNDNTQGFRYKEFGDLVRQWRQAVRPPMTQRELAEKIEVTSGSCAHVETGRTLPECASLVAISRALGVPSSLRPQSGGLPATFGGTA